VPIQSVRAEEEAHSNGGDPVASVHNPCASAAPSSTDHIVHSSGSVEPGEAADARDDDESLQLLPYPGAAITHQGRAGVLLRPNADGRWTVLFRDGCSTHNVPRAAFIVEEVFCEDMCFIPDLSDLELDELASTMHSMPGQFLALSNGALAACGGPFAPDIPAASKSLLSRMNKSLTERHWHNLRRAVRA